MTRYLEFVIPIPAEEMDVILADLFNLGFESFEETDKGLKAFISQSNYLDLSGEILQYLDKTKNFHYDIIMHEPRDWNKVWESNFDPVIIKDKIYIRASFHASRPDVETEILIAPQMAFGTGHHSTTKLILEWMSEVDFNNKRVLDFGCGTGILGIYAKMRGASEICLIDNDKIAILNAKDTLNMNYTFAEHVYVGDIDKIPNIKYHYILCNITRNTILERLEKLAHSLTPTGIIAFSGFYVEDASMIEEEANKFGLQKTGQYEMNEWCLLLMTKRNPDLSN